MCVCLCVCACVCVSILRCVRITDTGLGYLSTMSSLRSLYLRWCCQVHWALNLPLLHIRRPYSHLSIHFTLSPLQSVCQSIYLSICCALPSLSLSIYLSISLSLSISFFPFSWNGHSLSPTHTIHSHLCVVMPVCCCMLLLSLFVSGISSFPSSLFHFGCLPLLPLPPLCIPLFLPSYSIVFGNAYPGPGLHWHGREPKLLARGLTLRAPENLIYIYN